MKSRDTKPAGRKKNSPRISKKRLLVNQICPTSIYAVSIIFVLLCTVGVFAPNNTNYSDFYREAIAEIGTIALLVYWFYRNRKVQDMTITIDVVRVFLIALFIFASVSVFWAVNVAFFVSKYFLWLAAAGILLLALTLAHNTKTYIILARTLVLIATYISIVGLVQALLSIDVFVQAKPPAANFVNRNAAAQVLVLIFPISLFLLLVDKNKYLSKLYPFIMALMLAYIFHTGTKAAWLSIGFESILIIAGVIWQRKQIKEIIKKQNVYVGLNGLLLVISASILLLFLINLSAEGWAFFGAEIADKTGTIYNKIHSYNNQLSQTGEVRQAGRYILWGDAIEMIKQSPFVGSGMGSFFHNMLAQADRYHKYGILRAHNDILELAVELGVVGWILLSGVMIGLVITLHKIITRAEAEYRLFYLLIAAGLAGSALNMQFSFPYQLPVPLMLFGLYIGCIIKAGDVYSSKTKTIKLALNNWHWRGGISFIGLIFISVVAVNFIWLNATNKMIDNFGHAKWPNDLVNNPLVCHKTLVKSLNMAAVAEDKNQNYHLAAKVIESLNKCIPNTWSYYDHKAVNFIRLKRYDEALHYLKLSRQHAPKEFYASYLNEIIVYSMIDDSDNLLKAYQALIALPIDSLKKQPKFLKKIIMLSLSLKQKESAEKFYRLYRQHYLGKPFIAKVSHYFPEKHD